MSQMQPSGAASSSRTALVVAIIGLVLGAAGLGYAVYLGASQVPSQLSSLPAVSQTPNSKLNVTIEWVSSLDSGQDRFSPAFITIAQGDTVRLTFMSNDTGDGHTFTLKLLTGVFQLNSTMAGQTNFLTGGTFAGNATGTNGKCLKDDTPVPCNTSIGPCLDKNQNTVACTSPNAVTAQIFSTGSFTVVTPGTYRYRCIYHESVGMFGWLVVLPNKGFQG